MGTFLRHSVHTGILIIILLLLFCVMKLICVAVICPVTEVCGGNRAIMFCVY